MAALSDMTLPFRVLQLHNEHASRGGADYVLDHEAQLLRAAGHEVERLTTTAAERASVGQVRAAAKSVWNLEMCRELAGRIERWQPDVVHVHTPFPVMSPAVFRTAKRRGVSTVATLHSYRYSCVAGTCHRDSRICEDCIGRRLKWPGVVHRCYHESLAGSLALTSSLTLHRATGTFRDYVDRYVCLTPFARDLMVRDGYPEAKLIVKANSVEDPGPPTGAPDPGDPYVLFVGRLVDVKGVRTLLDAWRRASSQRLRLVVAGDGDLARLVTSAASVEPRLAFTGWLPEPEVSRLMAGALATVLPSQWYEGQPLVGIRSLSVGTPVISSDLENLSADLVAAGVAWPFQTGDAEDLSRVLRRVEADPSSLLELRKAARTTYERSYSPPGNLRRLEEIYSTVTGRLASAGPSTGDLA